MIDLSDPYLATVIEEVRGMQDDMEALHQIHAEREQRAVEACRRVLSGVYGESDVRTITDEIGITNLVFTKGKTCS